MVVTTTGYIVTVLGPYLDDGKNSDSKILNHMMNSNIEEIKNLIRKGDIFVVDRGFRDSLNVLKELGIDAKMPSFLPKGEKQLSTKDANNSRLVTKIRWIVESANARLKQWIFFDKTLPNSHLPNIEQYMKIICAVCNKYKPPLSKASDRLADFELGTKMFELAQKNNELQNEVEKFMSKESVKTKWKLVDSNSLKDFPILSEEELRQITLGVYTLKMAKCYTTEHLEDDAYSMHISNDIPGVLQAKLQSRHTSSVKYKCWIKYSTQKVISWYCRFKNGNRVVGSCSHVASVIWYLAIGRFSENQWPRDWNKYVKDAYNKIGEE